MSQPHDIPNEKVSRSDSYAENIGGSFSDGGFLSRSPQLSFHSPPHTRGSFSHGRGSFSGPRSIGGFPVPSRAKTLKPFATTDIKVLLLENVNTTGIQILEEQGYQVESLRASLNEDELIEKIRDVQVIGIRSKTKLNKRVLEAAKNLIVVGCFCIGTNQVDLQTAAQLGIAVFNSPFANSRSVAELTIAEIVCLARQLADRSAELHRGTWNKVSAGCWEIRGKTLGIIGYGHIGSQLSVLAEAMGMTVIYYDIIPLMAMGSARQVKTLDDLLSKADFISLHVPELPETKNLMGAAQFARMRDGSYLINNSRGSVVDIPAFVDAMRTKKLAGAAIDVFPSEPKGNGDYFTSAELGGGKEQWIDDLRTLKNLIMTPHIGGSTEEAQSAIGVEVATALVKYVNEGTTIGAVNMPEVSLRGLTEHEPNHARVVFIHKNVPGVLRKGMCCSLLSRKKRN